MTPEQITAEVKRRLLETEEERVARERYERWQAVKQLLIETPEQRRERLIRQWAKENGYDRVELIPRDRSTTEVVFVGKRAHSIILDDIQ